MFEAARADELDPLSNLAKSLSDIAEKEISAHAEHGSPDRATHIPTAETIAINGLRAHLILLTKTVVKLTQTVTELLHDTDQARELGIE